MSIEWIVSSSGLILLVLLVRFLFRKKISPCLRYALWLVVALRLLLPVSISGTAVSILNLLPEQEMIWERQENRTGQIVYEQKGEPDSMPEGTDIAPQPETLIIEKEIPVNMQVSSGQELNTEAANVKTKTETVKAENEEVIENFFRKEINVSKAIKFFWLLGAGMCGSIFLVVNLDYRKKLRRSRKSISPRNLPVMSEIPVYETQMPAAPCLFGALFPAIYIREDMIKDEKTFLFVLCHENTHYRHHDHWWALVRIGCLCVHWFNPLVWLAFGLSRQDAEMACDEKTLKILGDKARVDYGKTLLELSAEKEAGINSLRVSTTMSGSARQMKERLLMIVKTPGRTIGMQILVLLLVMLLSIITFTGKSMAQEREEANASDKEEVSIDIENEEPSPEDGLAETKQTDEPGEILETDNEIEAEKQVKTSETPEMGFYREMIPVSIGEKEYELWYEGHTDESSFYMLDTIMLVDPEKPDQYVDIIETEEISRAYWNTADGAKALAVHSVSKDGGILTVDLNFDGWNDLCFQGWYANGANTPYYCMLWNPDKNQYEYSAVLCNVEVDAQQQWISVWTRDGGGQYSTTYYRYDEADQLHMVRYVEENLSPDAVFAQLDLTYVEDDSPYMLPAIVDEEDFYYTLLIMAKQALTELYQWTGEKVDTACFQVSNMGDVFFGLTPADIVHSRIFYSRAFGADTEYNLSNYEKSISSMYVTSGRSVWYSPVLWRIFPEQMDKMTDEEIMIWYLERIPLVKECKVKSIEKRYQDMWTIQTEDGVWFEVVYDVRLKEIGMVTGPYPDYPVH